MPAGRQSVRRKTGTAPVSEGRNNPALSPVQSDARRYYRNSLGALSKAGPLARYLATGNDSQTYARIYDAMRRHVGPVTGLSIFELGTAQGVFLFQLKQEGALVSGVEMNGELADYARREGQMEVATANVLSPSWALSRRTFDVTLSRNLLDALVSPGPRHGRDQPLLPGDARRLAEVIFRITRPGGWSIHQTIDEPRMRTQDFLDAGFELTKGSVESKFVVFHRPVGPDRTVSSPVVEYSDASNRLEFIEETDADGSLTVYMGEISLREASHSIYVNNQYAGHFIFRRERAREGKLKWILTNVSLDPFWRRRGIVTKVMRWFVDRARRENALVEISAIGNPLMIAIADQLLSDIYVTVSLGTNQLLAMEILGPVTIAYGGEDIGELKIEGSEIVASRMQKQIKAFVEEGRVVAEERVFARKWRLLYFTLYSRHHISALNMGKLFRMINIVGQADRGLYGRLHFRKDGSLDTHASHWNDGLEVVMDGFKPRVMDKDGHKYDLNAYPRGDIHLQGTPRGSSPLYSGDRGEGAGFRVRDAWQESWAFQLALWFESYYFWLWYKMTRKVRIVRDWIVLNVPEALRKTGSMVDGQAFKVNPPVGAVVQVSSSPVSDLGDETWRNYWAEKLAKQDQGSRDLAVKLASRISCSDDCSSLGQDQLEFRKFVEAAVAADPDSPWQAVLAQAGEAEARGSVAVQAQPSSGGIQFSVNTFSVH